MRTYRLVRSRDRSSHTTGMYAKHYCQLCMCTLYQVIVIKALHSLDIYLFIYQLKYILLF